MHLFLKYGKQEKLLTVDLVDGYIPSLIGYSEAKQSNQTNSIEPASWFKVMVIETVSIDCEKSTVRWTVNSPDSSAGKEHTMFNDQDLNCYDFDDDLDELYQLAFFLVKTNPMAVLNKKERNALLEEFEMSVFRLLHCYILDKVALHPEDIPQVERAFNLQKHAILVLEESILTHRRLSEHHFSELRELHESRILPFFTYIIARGGCTEELIALLLKNVDKDVKKITNEVDIAQRRVEDVKLKANHGSSNVEAENALAKARGKRDIAFAKMHQLLEWREMLSMQRRDLKPIHVNGPMEPVLLQYVSVYERFQNEKQIANELCDKKVRAVSVRVSIETALKDLKRGKESYGEGADSDGHKPTDVIMDQGSSLQWKTLSGRLSLILHNIEDPNGKMFYDFTMHIIQKCNQIFRTYERVLETGSVAVNEEFVIVNHRNIDFHDDFDEIKAEILAHLEKASFSLLAYFQKSSQTFARKLRLCYEKLFFNEVGDYIIRLYRIVNGNIMVDLEKRVVRLRDLPVCRLGLQMKNEWWLSLFDPTSAIIGPGNDVGSVDNSDYQDVCSDYFDDDDHDDNDTGNECKSTQPQSKYLQINDRIDSINCDRKIGFLSDKLQAGAAKVLSRSLNELSTATETNIIKHGADMMADEISAKVRNNLHLMPFKKVFGSFRKEVRSYTSYDCNDDAFSSFDQGCRNRSVSTPNLLTSELEKKMLEYQRPPSGLFEIQSLLVQRKDRFNRHFGEVIHCIRNVFHSSSPLNKGQCLTESLSKMVQKVAKLRSRRQSKDTNEAVCAVSAEDLLPLLVLMLLKLKTEEVSKLYVEMCFISDMLVDFLCYGCHSYALTVFQTAFRVLSQVFDDLDFP